MQMRPIQEFIRLATGLDRKINILIEDEVYMTLPTAQNQINKLRERRRIVQTVLDNFIMFQWMIDNNIKDYDLLNG